MSQGRGYHGLPFSFRFRNGFQIVFFGDCDHGRVRIPPNACSLTLPLRRFVSVRQSAQNLLGTPASNKRTILRGGASGERCREGRALISC
jgi:hypothetical protein